MSSRLPYLDFGIRSRNAQPRITNYLPEPEPAPQESIAGIQIVRSDLVADNEILVLSDLGARKLVINPHQRVPGVDPRPWGYYPPLYTRHMAGVIELERDRRHHPRDDERRPKTPFA